MGLLMENLDSEAREEKKTASSEELFLTDITNISAGECRPRLRPI